MNMIPLLYRVLVKQDKLEEKDVAYKKAGSAGIIIPHLDEKVREQNAIDTGVVVALGVTAFKDQDAIGCVEVGDCVVFAKHAGKVITHPETDEKFVCLNDEDLCVVFKKEPVNG